MRVCDNDEHLLRRCEELCACVRKLWIAHAYACLRKMCARNLFAYARDIGPWEGPNPLLKVKIIFFQLLAASLF